MLCNIDTLVHSGQNNNHEKVKYVYFQDVHATKVNQKHSSCGKILSICKVEENLLTKPLKVWDIIAPNAKQAYKTKDLADGGSNIHFFRTVAKASLSLTFWPQKTVLQACYERNFYLEPTLYYLMKVEILQDFKPKHFLDLKTTPIFDHFSITPWQQGSKIILTLSADYFFCTIFTAYFLSCNSDD